MYHTRYLPECILIPFFGIETPIVGIEIGVEGAGGSAALLTYMPNLTLYSIDPFLHMEGKRYEAGARTQDNFDYLYQKSLEKIASFGERGHLIRVKSDDAVSIITMPIDFVWIDGDHEYEQVKRDLANWKPKLKSKSILAGHDWQNEEVHRAILEMFKLEEIRLGDDSIWWITFNESANESIT